MTIQGLINKIFRANQTQTNTVSWSGSNGLKTIQEDIVETIRQRTFFTVPTTADLVNQGFNNAVLCYVQDHAFFRWQAQGIPNGTTIFPANDGGVWVQETVGDTDGTVTNVSALTLNTSGTDLSSTVANPTTTPVITLSVPTASAVNRGVLSPTDWSTFNSKQNALTFNSPLSNVSNTVSISQSNNTINGYLSSTDWTTFNNKQNSINLTTTGTSGAATLVGSTLNIPQYQSVLTNPVTGTGTTNYLSKWTSSSTLNTSLIYDNGTNVGIGTTSPGAKLDVSTNAGRLRITQNTAGNTLNGLEFAVYNGTVLGGVLFNQSTGEVRLNTISSYFPTIYSNGAEVVRIPTSGNVLIGTTTDAGYKLFVNGTQLISFGSVERGVNFTHDNGTSAQIVIGNGSAAGTGVVEIHRNYVSAISIRSSVILFNPSRLATSSTFFVTGPYGGANIGTSVILASNTTDQGVYTATSGTQNTVVIGNSNNEIWSPSSGNATYNLLTLSPVINTSGTYAGTVRGLYINPTLTSTTGTTYNAIEATGGNVVFGSNSIPTTLYINGGYGGASNDIYLINAYGTNNVSYGVGTKQWLLIGRGSIPTTSGIAGINLGNNQYESGLLFATASGGVFSEKMRIWNTGNVTINSTTDAGYKLDVIGDSRIKGSGSTSGTTTFRVENSSGGSAFRILGDGTVNMGFNANLTYDMSARGYGSNGGYGAVGVYLYSQNYGNAAGTAATIQYSGSPAGVTSNGLVIGGGFALQSATYNALAVNQSYTGLGTNTLVGYLFDPTLDATFPAANIISIKTTKGNVQLATTSGNVLIGTTTDAGYKLDVYGTLRVYSGNGSRIEGGGSFTATGFCNFNGAAQSVAGTNCGLLNVQSSLSVGFQGAADASAIMQANSTTKGFLPPRMTNAQRIAISSPAVGLMVYCTDVVEGLYIYKSTGWTFIV